VSKRNIGRFFISRQSVYDWRSLMPVFSQIVVVDARAHFALDLIEYCGFSDLFEAIEEGVMPPLYDFEFTRTLSGEILTKCKKSDKPFPYL
jgi:hypothetical protein